MARPKFSSPRLELKITPESYERAIQSSSGGCLIADAIKEQYPQYTRVSVDMATIRLTDPERGERYTYLTSSDAQYLLLSFDQGWPRPIAGVETVSLRKAVHIQPITRTKNGKESVAAVEKRRQARIAVLEKKADEPGGLNREERAALTRMRKNATAEPPARPTARGKAQVNARGSVVRGGRPIVQGPAYANLLRGRNRHFGAKMADPGQAFQEAVDLAVGQRLAEAGS